MTSMMITKSQGKDIYHHILTTILGQAMDSNIDKAIKQDGADHIHAFSNLKYIDLDAMTYDDGNGNQVALKRTEKALIMFFVAFLVYRECIGNKVTDDDWMSLTQAEYDDFHTSPSLSCSILDHNYHIIPSGTPITPSTTATTTGGASICSPVTEFKKGIKHDPSLFPVLQDQKQWDEFCHSTIGQAAAQDVSDVLDHVYVPGTVDEINLFKEKQKYMYAVFLKTFKTAKGKAIV